MPSNEGDLPVLIQERFVRNFYTRRVDVSPSERIYGKCAGKRKREEEKNNIFSKYAKINASNPSEHVVNLLNRRQSGHRHNAYFIPEVSALKAKQLSFTDCFLTAHNEIHVSNCEFIRGARDGKSVIGLWKGDSYKSIIYRLRFEFNSKYGSNGDIPPTVKDITKVGPFYALTQVRDMCDARFRQQNCVLYVGDRLNESSIIEGSTVLCNFTNDAYTYGRQYISKKSILSCAGNAHGELFATGTEHGCYIFDDDRFTYKARLPGNVRSVEFNPSGKMLFCGVDTSGLTVFDLREPPWNKRTVRVNRFGPVGVSETKLLSDEKTMIVNGIDGNLSKIDLNKNETVFQYAGHVGSSKKVPFSLNENADILCATGSDYLTRIWSLSTGKPLHTIQPMYMNEKCHSCLICHENKWFVALLQKDKIYTLEPRP